ncbi:MAG: response regulator [Pirellulales bacterium]
MNPTLRILFVDDEQTFLQSTVDLLRRMGYECDGTTDVEEACLWLESNTYDLAITDINIPGNVNLEFVQKLAAHSDGLPVILVTAFPSISSAIHSVELPVVAYLVKPFEFADLLTRVQGTARRVAALRAVREELKRLQDYRRGLLRAEEHMRQSVGGRNLPSVQAFVGMAMRNVVDCLVSLRRVAEDAPHDDVDCELHHWPHSESPQMREALRDAVATLERTKTAFKSKELGELRRKLEGLLN